MTSSTTDVPRRVLLVCPVADEIGGAEQVMLAIARGLPAHGFAPKLAVMRPGRLAGLARSQGIDVASFDEAHRYRDASAVWRAGRWLAELVRRSDAAVMHSTHTAHLYAAIASRRTGVPEVWHLHDAPTGRDLVDRAQRLFQPAHSIATTRAVARGFGELKRRRHTIVAPSCVDPAYLRDQPATGDVRSRLGLPAEGPLLLTVARLQAHKGHIDLLDAAAIVRRQRPDACFAIVGKASTPDQERYRDELLSRAAAIGMGDAVRMLGFVDDADLAALYREAIALVHPAWSEGYGLVLLEAMGMNLPVVAAAADGPAEIIRDGANGILVPPRDPPALAAAILRVIGDAPLRKMLVAGGVRTSRELTLDQMVRGIVDVYNIVLGQSASTAR